MDTNPSDPVAISIPQLLAELEGRVIAPDDDDYDQARTVFCGGIDRRPAVIIRAADATDVSRVVSLARETELELAVRSGGHSTAGHSVVDGGIVLDLSDMRALDIDAERRTAWAQTGMTTGDYTTAAGAHGLATGFGDTGSVGIGGITLGGGVGYLVRKHGLTIDDLLAGEVVTADGQLLRVDAETHPDLFWAIRGGGGNFGVATRFRFRLHEVDTIVGGMLMVPATPEIIASFIAEAGQRAVAPFRALATPIADMVKPMPYPEIYPPEDEEYHPTAVGRTMFVDTIDGDVAETVFEYLRASDATMRVAQLRVLGGAMARVPDEATAFAHRGSRIMVNVAGFYEGPEDRGVREAWVGDFAGALQGGHTWASWAMRRGADPRGLPGLDMGPARGDQGSLRPDQPVPAQPEHPAGDRGSWAVRS